MKRIFISYKRAEPTAKIADLLERKIRANLPKEHGFDVPFLDRREIAPGDEWREKTRQALAETTYFVALLSDEYWDSPLCQEELLEAVDRYERTGAPRLLFVMSEYMDAAALTIADGARSGTVERRFPKVSHLGQINFLGPYDPKTGRLVRLSDNDATLKDQLFWLVQDIKKLP